MNRRGFIRSAIAALALTTGLARARLDIIEDPFVDDGADFGDTVWIEGVEGSFRIVSATENVFTLDRPIPWNRSGHATLYYN